MIPVNEPLLTEADYASVMQALRSGFALQAGARRLVPSTMTELRFMPRR